MRAFIHVGLAVAIALAPTLCCCQAHGLWAVVRAAPAQECLSCSESRPVPAPVESCCVLAKTSCCHAPNDTPAPHHAPEPAKSGAPGPCACCDPRPDAAQSESKPTVAVAEPTGELLPSTVAARAAGSPEHPGRFREFDTPTRAGVDARYAALFERHVMHC